MQADLTGVIYGLVDPRDLQVRYVGKTVDLGQRLSSHLREARRGTDTRNYRWIRFLFDEGLSPAITILGEYSVDELDDAEQLWIAMLRSTGRLTNLTDGGTGGATRTGAKNSPEWFQRMREVLAGKPLSAEHRAKLSVAHKGQTAWNKGKTLGPNPAHIARMRGRPQYRTRGPKLTPEKVFVMRMLANSGMRVRLIAQGIGVDERYARDVIKGISWSHVS